jgi:hypothetical protein
VLVRVYQIQRTHSVSFGDKLTGMSEQPALYTLHLELDLTVEARWTQLPCLSKVVALC